MQDLAKNFLFFILFFSFYFKHNVYMVICALSTWINLNTRATEHGNEKVKSRGKPKR